MGTATPSSLKDEQTLLALDTYQVLTAEQVTRLFYGNSLTWVRKRLASFSAPNGLVLRDSLSTPDISNRRPYYYQLTSRGYQYLKHRGYPVGPRSHHSRKTTPYTYLHVHHTLTVNDVLISLELLCRETPGYSIAKLIHEHTWKNSRFYDRVTARLPKGPSEQIAVVPDSWIDIETPHGRACISLEVDMGTAHDEGKWRSKIRGYSGWLDGVYQKRFGTDIFMLLVVSPIIESGAMQLLKITESELQYLGASDLSENIYITSAHPANMSAGAFVFRPHWLSPFQQTPSSLF